MCNKKWEKESKKRLNRYADEIKSNFAKDGWAIDGRRVFRCDPDFKFVATLKRNLQGESKIKLFLESMQSAADSNNFY